MSTRFRKTISIAVLALATAHAFDAAAEDRIEGTVVRTKLTQCDMATHRCEGSFDLQAGKSSKEETTIRVVADTTITKGDERLYLPALRKNVVSVTYVTDKGEKVARAIEVLPRTK